MKVLITTLIIIGGLMAVNLYVVEKHRNEYPPLESTYCLELKWHDNNCIYKCYNYNNYIWFFLVFKTPRIDCIWQLKT